MADPRPPLSHQTRYDGAVKMFEDGDIDKAVAEAQHNLGDFKIPPYYYMKNCILIACGQEDWQCADAYKYAAEVTYAKAHGEATRENDTDYPEDLEEVRDDFDQLTEKINEQTGVRVHFDTGFWDCDALEGGDQLEDHDDSDEFEKFENAAKVAAKHIVLPLRTSGPAASGSKVQDAKSPPTTPTPTQTPAAPFLAGPASATRPPTLRSSKSIRWSKGGAYDAHRFTKSIGKSSGLGPTVRAQLRQEWAVDENKDKERSSKKN